MKHFRALLMKKLSELRQIYSPATSRPMNVVCFASGGGNNLSTILAYEKAQPDRLSLRAVVTDREGIAALNIATNAKKLVISRPFPLRPTDCNHVPDYERRCDDLHAEIYEELIQLQERQQEPIDLIVLSYRRIIRGILLEYFNDKMINQHPGDLSIRDPATNKRQYVGLHAVRDALNDGRASTRTSCFLVNEGMDTGEILCSGPHVPYCGERPVNTVNTWKHELIQKKQSDRPTLMYVLESIACGRLSIHQSMCHEDGRRVVFYNQKPLPYEGIDLSIPSSV